MELIEFVVRAIAATAESLPIGSNKKTGKTFYIIAAILVIAIFLFTLIMSQ